MALQHLRSSTADKRPTPGAMSDGQLALNTNLVSPGLFFKDSNGDSVKIGPIHVGATAPNATPGAGGQAGNSKGEAWLDTSATNPILKVFNGSAFVAVQPVGTGTVVSTTDTGSVTSTMILDGTILNADVNASAAIAYSKLAALTSANILVGNASNVATSTAVTGDVTISNAGVTAIAAGAIVNADVNASAAIADTKLATISTAGKVSNSATTATSANTASAIVARDASGNFSAGTITSPGITRANTITIQSTGGDGAIYLEALNISNGNVRSVSTFNNSTTTTGSELRIISSGTIQRISSSIKYKKDVETLEDQYVDAVIDNARPTWYRSKCAGDNPGWGHYGFIAEELVQIDPRLVCLEPNENGSYLGADGNRYEPEGVQYQSIVPLLVNAIKRQKQAIETLESSNADLLARVSALESA